MVYRCSFSSFICVLALLTVAGCVPPVSTNGPSATGIPGAATAPTISVTADVPTASAPLPLETKAPTAPTAPLATVPPASATSGTPPRPVETAAPAPSPAPLPPGHDEVLETIVELPANCHREGLATFVDRSAGLCFAYPQGFTLGKNGQGETEVRGPAAGQGSEPLSALLTVSIVPYQGVDLAPFTDQMLKDEIPAGYPVKVERKPSLLGQHGAEVLEPMPGRLSSRVVVIDNSPVSFVILRFWPSFLDTTPDKLNAESKAAQKDVNALYEIVSASFATLPPTGVPIDPASRLEVRQSCLVAGQPLFVNASDRYCFSLPPDVTPRREANGQMSFYGPNLDKSPDPLRATLSLTVEVAVKDATLEQIADAYLASFKDLGGVIRRSAISVGGAPAVRLDGVSGRPTAIEILLLHEGTLFQFRVAPDLSFAAAQNEVTALIQAITTSFGFLPAPAGSTADNSASAGMGFSYPASVAQATSIEAGMIVSSPAQLKIDFLDRSRDEIVHLTSNIRTG